MGKTRVGFDIGAGDLKIVQCDSAGIRRLAVEPMPDSLVKGGQIVSYDAMVDFIKRSVKKNHISGRDCGLVLSGGEAFLRRLTVPTMTAEQLSVNLPYEFRDYLTMDKDKYFYDYAVNAVKAGEDGAPGELDLTAAAISKETISNYVSMFRRAGFKLRTAAPPECAYANLIRAKEARETREPGDEGEREYCILDLGHTATRIYIFTGSRLEASRVIEYGSAMVDAAIADALGVDEHMAHAMKEANHDGAQELEGSRSVYANIAVEIRKAINFYSFNNRASTLQDAYFCGGGAYIPALLDAITGTVDLSLKGIRSLLPGGGRFVEKSVFAAAAVGITLQ